MDTLKDKLIAGDRAALARAITLAESTREDHQREAEHLLADLLTHTGKSIRIGITGVPGVGKSTFIEAFGLHLIEQGHKVAVLAVDPSSARTGGSIMGDKTRMMKLAQHPSAYIRPSPSAGTLGGVARRTREAMLLCEAAGYDVILIETVGVGQSETEVADMTDLFMLLLLPGSGDELQGIKRGIMEMADLVVVNKADGDLLAQAKRVKSDYTAALRMLTPHGATWQPRVELCSALSGSGIAEVWQAVEEYSARLSGSGELEAQRLMQAQAWMWKEIREMLFEDFLDEDGMLEACRALEKDVAQGKMLPSVAARRLIGRFRQPSICFPSPLGGEGRNG